MARIEAEKELAKRQRERVPAISQAQGEESDGMGQLMLDPTASSLGHRGLLAPYDPSQPGWDINLYAPSADVRMVDEDFNGLMKKAADEINDIAGLSQILDSSFLPLRLSL
ncbi:hypothetical protein K435DRAFT_862898 [Dendrothele bispora CBS 962.96]|uniref:Uncharacterized protein n=1 Tax=Dendrothele bispora (strain CBS 962.96) TaxID=1314807 RepID=A0A4S8LRF5_DENBC|nr:hypothetical protein K435DRAFT_862898 [Dendrothele bispora CBS 962.96]